MVSPCRPSSSSWRIISVKPVVVTVVFLLMVQKLHPYTGDYRRGALGVDFGYAPAAAVGGKFVARLRAVFHVAEFGAAALLCRQQGIAGGLGNIFQQRDAHSQRAAVALDFCRYAQQFAGADEQILLATIGVCC